MSIKEKSNLTPEERAAHEAKNGNYNAFPPGWRELSQVEFAQSMYFHYGPELVEYRQMLPEAGPVVSAHLNWYFDGTGIALVSDHYAGTVRFYAFGERNPKAWEGIDSSD